MSKLRALLPFLIVTLLALGLRLYMLLGPMNPIEADQSIVGIMAMHILEGERPIFFYGLSYQGPLDAYITAPLIAIFGPSRLVIRIAALLFSLIFIWVTYWVGKRLYSRDVGWYSALYAAFPPFMLMFRGLMADADYIMLLIAGSLSLLTFHSWLAKPSIMKFLGVLVWTALGFWFHPVMGYYVLAMFVVWLVGRLKPRRSIEQKVAENSFGWMPLKLAGIPAAAAWSYVLIMVTFTMPVILGFLVPPPYAARDLAAQFALRGPFLDSLAVFLSGSIVILVGWVGLKLIRQGQPLMPVFAFFTVYVYAMFSIFVQVKVDSLTLPRYLMPIYSAIPLGIYALFDLTRRRAWLRPLLMGGLLIINIYGDVTMKPAPAPYELLDWLVRRPDVSYVYTDYWTGYWLAFESRERVIPAIFDENNRPGENRYPKYWQQVQDSENPLHIYREGGSNEHEFRLLLDRNGVSYMRENVEGYVIYSNLSRGVVYPLQLK